MTTTFTHNTHAAFPPASQSVGEQVAGTITNVATQYGPCICQIYSAAGVLLTSIDSTKGPVNGSANPFNQQSPGFSISTSIAFTGGAPVVVQQSPSDITVTIEA